MNLAVLSDIQLQDIKKHILGVWIRNLIPISELCECPVLALMGFSWADLTLQLCAAICKLAIRTGNVGSGMGLFGGSH